MKGLPDGALVHGRELERGFEESCDVVVVGSGAGGATVAAHLAEAGLSVIVLEEGPYYRHEDLGRFTPTESLRRLFRDAGLVVAAGIGQTPEISLTLGRAVGGSSLLTGGVCFRIPSDVHDGWVREQGLEQLSERALEPAYEDVERRLSVREVPESMRSESTRRFVAGAERLGIEMEPTRRNTGDRCEGNARCNFGCPIGAKRSVDVAYLPSAVAHGTRIVSDALVEHVRVEGGRAAGVSGRLLGGRFGAASHRFTVRARAVVACCGTIHTPQLLQRLGLRSYGLGRFITLHPSGRLMARFRDEIRGWNGALQSAYSDHFHRQGFKLMSAYSSVNILAAGFPGVGPVFRRRAEAMGHYAVFGCLIHDDGGGSVHRLPFMREPMLRYRMAPVVLARLRRAFRVLTEIALEAGAEEVVPPIFGVPAVRTRTQAAALETDPLDARRIECMAFHPLGSARMSNDPRRGVVDQRGECWELPGLYVADGSVLPSSIGVNSQEPIMAIATRTAWSLRDRWRRAH